MYVLTTNFYLKFLSKVDISHKVSINNTVLAVKFMDRGQANIWV